MTTWKEVFLAELLAGEDPAISKYYIMNKDTYRTLIEEIKEAKLTPKKTAMQYRRVNRFDVIIVDGVERIIAKSKGDEKLQYLPAEEIFDVIEEAHVALGHAGRDRLRMETSKQYANITTKMINLYLKMCDKCNSRKSKSRMHKSQLNSHCQLDVIDMQEHPDGVYKYFMVYEERLTKFILLRALRSNRLDEITNYLTEIFLTFGAPATLHFDYPEILNYLKPIWPDIKIAPTELKCGTQCVQNMINVWMNHNKTTNWSGGLLFIQYLKNRIVDPELNISPYKSIFGVNPKAMPIPSFPYEAFGLVEREETTEEGFEEVQVKMEEDVQLETDHFSVKQEGIESTTCFRCNGLFDGNFCLNCEGGDLEEALLSP